MVESIIKKLGKEPLTVEERTHFASIWKSATKIDKLEMASRICHISKSENSVAEDYINVVLTIQKFDRMFVAAAT